MGLESLTVETTADNCSRACKEGKMIIRTKVWPKTRKICSVSLWGKSNIPVQTQTQAKHALVTQTYSGKAAFCYAKTHLLFSSLKQPLSVAILGAYLAALVLFRLAVIYGGEKKKKTPKPNNCILQIAKVSQILEGLDQ